MLLFGQLKPYKGADILIRALAALPRLCGNSVSCAWSGGPIWIRPPLELARALQVEENIVWDLRFIPVVELPGSRGNGYHPDALSGD